MTLTGPHSPPPAMSREEARRLAKQYGLQQVGVRPTLGSYLKDLWRHKSFLLTMSAADSVARHQNNYLGQLWAVLNPLLLAFAYFLIFGLLLGTGRGVENFVGFLTIGLFTFLYMSAGWNYAAKSLVGNVAMVRALRFPRAILPLSVVLAELLASMPAFLVLVVIALLTGERPQLSWLLFPVAILIVAVTTAGMGLMSARLVHGARDLANLVPIITRMLRYTSGVFFSVATYGDLLVEKYGQQLRPVADALVYQPVAVSLTMVRETLLGEVPMRWETWAFASGWAVLLLTVGIVVFWRGEAGYGRA
ncbi:ABC transporter permease [Ornithinicoccus halotolerans]|uniref:ABC transporter permease n=1 Tax=Ornithinicoccus halotolerans TaxID=1748220 RepID=UPI001E2E1D13|nr:ABC transporter permease [Ornithinicoccus halotolerans]